jgi:hypothetical protein
MREQLKDAFSQTKAFLRRHKKKAYTALAVFLCYLMFYHHTDTHQVGIRYNIITGEMSIDKTTGHHFTAPWVLVTRMDTRPRRVCIESASRTMNCRLVQFDPSKYRELLEYEGFHYYWWYNRISFNWGQKTYRGVDNLLLGHAYGPNRCSCVKVLEEIGE